MALRNRLRRNWSLEDDGTLARHIATKGAAYVAKLLEAPEQTVEARAKELGLPIKPPSLIVVPDDNSSMAQLEERQKAYIAGLFDAGGSIRPQGHRDRETLVLRVSGLLIDTVEYLISACECGRIMYPNASTPQFVLYDLQDIITFCGVVAPYLTSAKYRLVVDVLEYGRQDTEVKRRDQMWQIRRANGETLPLPASLVSDDGPDYTSADGEGGDGQLPPAKAGGLSLTPPRK